MLNIKIADDSADRWKVALHGRLDAETAPDFDEKLQSFPAAEGRILVFDLAGLEFISSAGISALFRVQKRVKAGGGRTLLVHLQPQVGKVLEIVKTVDLKSVFRSIQELDDYIKSLQEPAQ